MLRFGRFKILAVLVACLFAFFYSMPNFFSHSMRRSWPQWIPHKSMNLGLDLRGGFYVLLEVDKTSLLKNKVQDILDAASHAFIVNHISFQHFVLKKDLTLFVILNNSKDFKKAKIQLKKVARELFSSRSLMGGGSVSLSNTLFISQGKVNKKYIFIKTKESAVDSSVRRAVRQSIEIIRRRIDALGTTEPIIQSQGVDRILVEVPGVSDPSRLKKLLGQTAKLTFHTVDTSMTAQEAIQTHVPSRDDILYMSSQKNTSKSSKESSKNQKTSNSSIKKAKESDTRIPMLIRKKIALSGDDLVDAQASFDTQTNQPVVNFRFNTRGAGIFARLTRKNVGKPFAIVLDNEIIEAPVVREPIVGGSGQISGNFTIKTANNLAILLRAGALPAKLNVLEEQSIGASLGASSIRAGIISSLVGLFFVIIFMAISYGLFGVFADISLLINLLMIMAILSLLQATLTLPGIAGVVLTLGMAVDANVLIYERIREEIRVGRSPLLCIELGYKRALGTILDSNITTLIAAIILFELGSGPIKGFAVTLSVGIVTSVFTAFTLNRLIVATWFKKIRPKKLFL